MIGFEGKALFYPLDHDLGGIDFLGDARRRRLDTQDDRAFLVDQLVEAIAEHHPVVPAVNGGVKTGHVASYNEALFGLSAIACSAWLKKASISCLANGEHLNVKKSLLICALLNTF